MNSNFCGLGKLSKPCDCRLGIGVGFLSRVFLTLGGLLVILLYCHSTLSSLFFLRCFDLFFLLVLSEEWLTISSSAVDTASTLRSFCGLFPSRYSTVGGGGGSGILSSSSSLDDLLYK